MSEIPRNIDEEEFEKSGHGISNVLGVIASVLQALGKDTKPRKEKSVYKRKK